MNSPLASPARSSLPENQKPQKLVHSSNTTAGRRASSGAPSSFAEEALSPRWAGGGVGVARKDVDEVATLEPLYVRAPEASVKSTAVDPGEGTNGTSRGTVDPA